MKQKYKSKLVLIACCLCALVIIMGCNIFIFLDNALWLNIVVYSTIMALILSLIWSFVFKVETLFKMAVVITVLFFVLYFLYYWLVSSGIIDRIDSFQDVKEFILSYGNWGLLTYTIINFLQVVLIPIPSTITILAGTAIFGPTRAFIFATLGILIGSSIAFLIGRYCSRPVIYWIFGKEKVIKYEKIISKRTKLFLFLTLFLPFFPDDMICMLAGITDIKYKEFLIISLIARSFGIATISYFGSGNIIPFDTTLGKILWCIIILAIISIGVVAYKKRKKIVSLFIRNKTHDD